MDQLASGAFWTGFAANLALAAYAWSVRPAREATLQAGVTVLLGTLLALNGRLEHAGLNVALYAVFGVAWTVRLIRRFAKPA